MASSLFQAAARQPIQLGVIRPSGTLLRTVSDCAAHRSVPGAGIIALPRNIFPGI